MFVQQWVSHYVDSQLETMKEVGVLSFLWEKLQERNPLHSSKEYQKQSKTLKKHLICLITMKRDYTKRLKEAPHPILQIRLNHLKQRIAQLKIELHYLQTQEKAQRLLKWSSPCNLIFPGSGDSVRIAAYSLKVFNVLNYNRSNTNRLYQMKKVAKEISIASSLSFVSSLVYGKVRSLKEYLSYTSFRSLIYSSLHL